MRLTADKVQELQSDPSRIRNICIMAHVDHGKTTLSDSLLATNGIISQKMAGKVRYLDSRQDEQLRGITMESSVISLYFKALHLKKGNNQENTEESDIREYLINLIDSPGHIDFSSEVSTASRLCDAAIVLVDVIEGVCSQSVNVLRQCWADSLKPILVLNKIDRLISQWQLTPLEAYQHLLRLIEQVNSVIGSLYAVDRMEDDMRWRDEGGVGEFVERDDEDLYFDPQRNNVIFASAIDGWSFSINTFSKIYNVELGFSKAVLNKTLWGNYYLDMKTKKILAIKSSNEKSLLQKPLFVSLILEQIWAIYGCCYLERDNEKIEKVISRLHLTINQRDMRSNEPKKLLNSIMSQWLPLSSPLLSAVIDYLPSPVVAQPVRMEKVLEEYLYDNSQEVFDKSLLDKRLLSALRSCDKTATDCTVAYVSKLISVPEEHLPKRDTKGPLTAEEILERGRKARELARISSDKVAALQSTKEKDDFLNVSTNASNPFDFEYEEDFEICDSFENFKLEEIEPEKILAVTRVYAGEISENDKLTVVTPKYNMQLPVDSPSNAEYVLKDVVVTGLYLMMGKEFIKISKVPAGNIVAIEGLSDVVLKNATLYSNSQEGPYLNFAATSTLIHNRPIMKIAIEPSNPVHLERLERGLDLLAKADPVLEWYIDDDSGEILLCVAGELHLERSLKDLEDRFAKGCEVLVKEPVIPFREGLADSFPDVVPESISKEYIMDSVKLNFEAIKIPSEIVNFFIKMENKLSSLLSLNSKSEEFVELLESTRVSLKQRLDQLECTPGLLSITNSTSLDEFIGRIICFGPKSVGSNILVVSPHLKEQFTTFFGSEKTEAVKFAFERSIVNGFQLATNEGPLAAEPMQGVLVYLTTCELTIVDDEINSSNMHSKILRYTKDLIHRALLSRGAHLYLAMYTCEIQASSEVLGKVYAVVQRRGGAIISEEMKEGTPFFTIIARVPVVEAFGFSEDIRKKTSGAATPQLVFDGYDLLDIDPFWVPRTEEELEELGEFAERENIARKYMNQIRRRKGLFVDEKVVKNAEKQRTLKKD